MSYYNRKTQKPSTLAIIIAGIIGIVVSVSSALFTYVLSFTMCFLVAWFLAGMLSHASLPWSFGTMRIVLTCVFFGMWFISLIFSDSKK